MIEYAGFYYVTAFELFLLLNQVFPLNSNFSCFMLCLKVADLLHAILLSCTNFSFLLVIVNREKGLRLNGKHMYMQISKYCQTWSVVD